MARIYLRSGELKDRGQLLRISPDPANPWDIVAAVPCKVVPGRRAIGWGASPFEDNAERMTISVRWRDDVQPLMRFRHFQPNGKYVDYDIERREDPDGFRTVLEITGIRSIDPSTFTQTFVFQSQDPALDAFGQVTANAWTTYLTTTGLITELGHTEKIAEQITAQVTDKIDIVYPGFGVVRQGHRVQVAGQTYLVQNVSNLREMGLFLRVFVIAIDQPA